MGDVTQNDIFKNDLYQHSSRVVLGFHGCDKSFGINLINSRSEHIKHSDKDYDWLGTGSYFWLNDPLRAYEWACLSQKRNPEKIKEPFVVGAIIDLGLCLDFCERQSILLLKKSYENLQNAFEASGLKINEELYNNRPDEGGFNLKRPLDCLVINNIHRMVEKEGIVYDTVCGYFQEGADAYEGAGIKEKSHIQICVRNDSCIKGYFLPRIR